MGIEKQEISYQHAVNLYKAANEWIAERDRKRGTAVFRDKLIFNAAREFYGATFPGMRDMFVMLIYKRIADEHMKEF